MSDDLTAKHAASPDAHPSSFILHPFPTLYPLTDRTLTKLSHAEQVARLAAGGARLIQLRDKHSTPAGVYDEACRAVRAAREASVRIIINDRADIALACGADGVHLGQDDLPAEAARGLLGDDSIIGVSTHNLDQARRAARAPVSYIAIGPVFATTTKVNPDAIVGLDLVRRVREHLPAHIPLVAIGGITHDNARTVLDHGADAVAVVGALLAVPDEITARTENLIACLA